jgi:hypothetical protein
MRRAHSGGDMTLVALRYAAKVQLDGQPPAPVPVVNLTLEHNGASVGPVVALVDSGADMTVITPAIARALVLPDDGVESELGSAWSCTTTPTRDPGVEIRGRVDIFTIGLRPIVAELRTHWPVVLGRADFFAQLTVAFDETGSTIWLGHGGDLPVPTYEEMIACR